MGKHMVTCVECGRQFDANRGGYYDKSSRRYTCKSCGKRLRADYNEQSTGMRQSTGAMIAKIAIGLIFIICGFVSPDSGWSVGYFLTALVIGGALIAWGIIPYLKAKKAKEEKQKTIMLKAKRCPSCGATTKGDFCEYCGTEL